ncbi:hypothetical protein JTB14_021571 [Gonioctena quinquepunctata]|nr:hypothetical protein JTB14_021571 [Gonioctena quinquepunctata]
MEGWNALLCALVCFFISINGQISNIDNGIYGKDGSPEELIYTNGLNYASVDKDGSLEKGIDTNGLYCASMAKMDHLRS